MIIVYTDGAMDGEGWSGAGFTVQNGKYVKEYSIPIGQKRTNHEAEFEAVVEALKICRKEYPLEILSFRLDARVVVDIVEKNYTKNKAFQPYLTEIHDLIEAFPHFFIKWIPQNSNLQADQLARKAIYLNDNENV